MGRSIMRFVRRYLCWPTARGWGLMVAAICSLFVTVVNPSLPGSIFTACLFALVVTGALMALGSLQGVRLEPAPSNDGTMGQPLLLPVAIHNRSLFAQPALLLSEELPFVDEPVTYTVVTGLQPGERRYLPRRVVPQRRGHFDLHVVSLRSGDPAGLFYREQLLDMPRSVSVYPERVPLVQLPLHLRSRAVAAAGGDTLGLAGAGQELFGVREYRPGDGLRTIHWKASARQRKLMVRQYEENAVTQVAIFLDTCAEHVSSAGVFNNFEYQVRAAASLSHHLSKLYARLLFRARAADGRTISVEDLAQSAVHQVLHELTSLAPCSGANPATLLLEALGDLPENTIVYCLTLHEPPTLGEAFEVLARRNVELRWIHAPPALFTPGEAESRQLAVETLAARRATPFRPLIVSRHSKLPQVLAYG